MFEWAILRGRSKILTLIKNISLVLRLQSLQLQGSYRCTISLQHSKEKAKLEIASYDPFNGMYKVIGSINSRIHSLILCNGAKHKHIKVTCVIFYFHFCQISLYQGNEYDFGSFMLITIGLFSKPLNLHINSRHFTGDSVLLSTLFVATLFTWLCEIDTTLSLITSYLSV